MTMRIPTSQDRWRARAFWTVLVSILWVQSARAEDPWRLEEAISSPGWLSVSGQFRARYETLDGQFRAGGSGGDQALALQTLLAVEADVGWAKFGIELQDSRVYLDDAGTPLTTSIVNPADVLQLYGELDLDGAFGQPEASLTLGRQTVSIGSRRVIERVEFANVIFAYTGAYWHSRNARGDEWHVVYVSPVGRLPGDRASIGRNDVSGDEEQWGRRFWGLQYRRADVFGDAFPDTSAEIAFYGLKERDTGAVATPNRDYLQPGLRLFREPAMSMIDFDVEGAYRTGSRRQTSAAADVRDLDVDAWTLHAHVGYTFDHPWRIRASLDYDYASGDDAPGDGSFGRYERLFGARRTDLGNTGIHGPLSPENIDAPGFRIEFASTSRLDGRVAYKAARLASSRDSWTVAGVSDPSGQSGRFIGHAIDGRIRYWVIPASLRMEFGASLLMKGRFASEAPNAPRKGDAAFLYGQFVQTF